MSTTEGSCSMSGPEISTDLDGSAGVDCFEVTVQARFELGHRLSEHEPSLWKSGPFMLVKILQSSDWSEKHLLHVPFFLQESNFI